MNPIFSTAKPSCHTMPNTEQLPKPIGAPPVAISPDLLPLNAYRVIIDARTPGEFDEDHIPGVLASMITR